MFWFVVMPNLAFLAGLQCDAASLVRGIGVKQFSFNKMTLAV
jgi:hypothetical protein